MVVVTGTDLGIFVHLTAGSRSDSSKKNSNIIIPERNNHKSSSDRHPKPYKSKTNS